ncbi:MAG TPA: DNA glycosylase, partial [Chthoniobacterales bacterium]|nr:DNA glycosylase [Chthoniobacterales bacterium]
MRRPAFETIEAPDFDLALTLDSGQVFHWEKCGRGFTGAIDSTAIYVEQRANQLRIDRGAGERVRRYFALDHSLPEIYATFPADKPMCAARDLCRGLRIIRQPKWECLATFITSSMKQVAHIRQMSRALRTRFGERIDTHGHELHAFPTAERIAGCSESDLRACALGYRAANLLATARRVSSDEANLDRWADLKDEEL